MPEKTQEYSNYYTFSRPMELRKNWFYFRKLWNPLTRALSRTGYLETQNSLGS